MEQSKKKFLQNMVGFSMMTWISFVIGFIATPIATRLFVPAELARVTMFTTYTALFGSFCYLGLDQAFVRFFREPPGGASKAGMFTYCALSSLAFSVGSSLLLLLGWQSISVRVVGAPDFGIFLCMCIFSFSTVMFRYLSLSYRMEQNAKLYTIQGVVQVLLTKIAYLAVGFGDARGKSAVILLTVLMGLFTFICVLIQRKRFERCDRLQKDVPFRREIWAFAAPLIPLTVITTLNTSVSTFALDALMDKATVGIFASALGLAATVNIVQAGFNTYWAPYVYEHYQNDDRERFFTVHRLMATLLTGFGLTLTLLQAAVYLLLGAKYRSSVVYVPFLFVTPICYCLGETTGMGIGIAKKSYWNTLIFLVSATVNIGLCFLLIPLLGGTGAAMASAGAASLALTIRTAVGERYYRAIPHYRYIVYTVGLMLAASFVNYLLCDVQWIKYLALIAIELLAMVLFRREIATLWTTLRQIARAGVGALRRKSGQTKHKGEGT